MKAIIGILFVVIGIAVGLYVGVWLCFIGGIIDVIEATRAETLVAMDVAIGVAKIIFSGLAGWLAALLLVLPGIGLIQSN